MKKQEIKVAHYQLFGAISREIERQAAANGISELRVESYQLNAIADGATEIIRKWERKKRDSEPMMGLDAWIQSDDTGMSSRTMAHHICGAMTSERNSYPHDPSDFGRCHRFLEAVPGSRDKIELMRPVSDIWSRLVDNWPALTALYIEELPAGIAPKLYARMKELGC